ncbi:MAG TPA: MmcQ/YjbR family DNA-binding protein [Candidatus Baltobacteraceae bacterium]|jgi:hypothetical protein|nr:MmcQ/YjbR family DNA-binding protein [Candidatus Baltobacteraceae bacterium]
MKPGKPRKPEKKAAPRKSRAPARKREKVPEPPMFATVREIALSLGGVEEVEEVMSYGTPGFKVNGQLFARLHQDGESLVVRMDFEQRQALMADDPATYFITDHYLNYEWILARLSRVHPDALRDLLRGAWRFAAASGKASSRGRARPL